MKAYTPLLCALLTTSSLPAVAFDDLATLGQALYFDTSLSKNRTQSCATCHTPDAGFADARSNRSNGAFSTGDDGYSLGDRNAPSAAYAAFSPPFHRDSKGRFIGGQFWDGRATDLAGQAGGPPLNPIEMGMPDMASVIARIRENDQYEQAFRRFFGEQVFDDPAQAYQGMTQSIAAFEKSPELSPFDSKYDRYLRGEYQLNAQEELGMSLFFSRQFTNCNQCHQLKAIPEAAQETFTDYSYHNIGVPTNRIGRMANGAPLDHQDLGLAGNPAVQDPSQAGKFKVPTLRNVAVTAPYMHNGVFQDLRTVVLFYNKYNSKSAKRQINPETGTQWAAPEVPDNLSLTELRSGPALDDRRIDALIAFLKTLTDRRYEHLLK
jgi:cytochrome c peroxidase